MAATPIVFFDIAGPDDAVQRAFYSGVFGWEIAPGGQVTAGWLPGTLRADPPEKVLYFGVPDITAALSAVTAAGGVVDAPRFEVPGVVVLGLFRDPAGNRMGMVEMDGDRPKIP